MEPGQAWRNYTESDDECVIGTRTVEDHDDVTGHVVNACYAVPRPTMVAMTEGRKVWPRTAPKLGIESDDEPGSSVAAAAHEPVQGTVLYSCEALSYNIK